MKKILIPVIFHLMAHAVSGQLTGSYTIPGSPYPTVASAIAALNASGVGSGGVTFNVTAGYTETFTTATAGYITSNTGTFSNQIIFQKSGAGVNPKITAPAGSGSMDAIICFNGVKYITFNGIDLSENGSNTNNTTRMEWGYAILKASGTQGSQNITIQNCTITLSASNQATCCIYSMNHTTASTNQLTVTSVSGQNSNIKIYGNTCTNTYQGIFVWGYADPNAPFTFYDQNNDIGSVAGNTVINFGGPAAVNVYGVYCKYGNNLTVANSNINGGSGTTYCLDGVYVVAGSNTNLNIYSNTITLSSTVCGDWINGIYIDGTNAGTTNTLNIYNNTVSGCILPAASAKECYFIYNSVPAATVNIYGNTVSNNTIGRQSTQYMIGTNTGITGNVYNNTVSGNQFTGGGTRYYTVENLIVTGNPSTLSIHDNVIMNNTVPNLAGTVGIYFHGIFCNTGTTGTINAYNNSFHDCTISGTNPSCGSEVFGIRLSGALSCILNAHHNSVYNITVNNSSGGWGTMYPFYLTNTSQINAYNNALYHLTCYGPNAYIIALYLENEITANIYNNYVYDLKVPTASYSLGPSLLGFEILTATTVNLYDNTLYFDAASTGSNFSSYSVWASTIPTLDMRNNILVNKSTPSGTGKTVAFVRMTTNYNTYSTNSNNNLFYAGIPGPNNLIYTDGTNSFQTLAAYQAYAVNRDQASVTEIPPFMNVATVPYNLHLQTNVVTQCESGGQTISVPISITTDFDGDPRYPNSGYPANGSYPPTAPDIGADEFGGLGTATAPTVVTNAATAITSNSATLNGTVTANGQNTTSSFDWGTTISYGNNIPATPSQVTGNTPTAVSANLSGLTMGTTYHFRCKGVNPIGTSYGMDVTFTTLCPLPGPAGTISGPANVCQGDSGYIYSIAVIPNAAGYAWSLPPGGYITAGSGTNSITVAYSASASSGNVTVYGINSCGNGTSSQMAVTVHTQPSPTLSGPSSICVNVPGNIYTTETGMTNYIWGITGGTITAGGNSTSNTATVTWTNTGSQSISVNYENSNGCDAISATVFPVTVNPFPGAAGQISGSPSVCSPASGILYSCLPIPNATFYIWTLPPGASIASGAGTNTITVEFPASASSGDMTVTGNNFCGNGGSSPPYTVSVNQIPPTPVISLQGLDTLVSSSPAGNQWYLDNILIPGATGQIYVALQGGLYSDVVTLNGCSSDTSNCILIIVGIPENISPGMLIVPNPCRDCFSISIDPLQTKECRLKIVNPAGKVIYEQNRFRSGLLQEIICIPGIPTGIYMVSIQNEDIQAFGKLIISR